MRARILVAAAVFSVAVAPAAAQEPPERTGSMLHGLGEVTPPGCDARAYKVPFTAVTDGAGLWIVARPAAIGVACDSITYGTGQAFAGPWSPESGGCIPAVGGTGARICIGAMPDRGLVNGIPFRYCPALDRCFLGDAWLARL